MTDESRSVVVAGPEIATFTTVNGCPLFVRVDSVTAVFEEGGPKRQVDGEWRHMFTCIAAGGAVVAVLDSVDDVRAVLGWT